MCLSFEIRSAWGRPHYVFASFNVDSEIGPYWLIDDDLWNKFDGDLQVFSRHIGVAISTWKICLLWTDVGMIIHIGGMLVKW